MYKSRKNKLPRAECLKLGDISDLTGLPVIHFDGACQPNPGRMGVGIYCKDLPLSRSAACGNGTSNTAEWLALEGALIFAAMHHFRSCTIRGDSRMVIRQINGLWKINMPEHMAIALRCNALLKSMLQVKIEWVPREQNQEADALSNVALTKPHPSY